MHWLLVCTLCSLDLATPVRPGFLQDGFLQDGLLQGGLLQGGYLQSDGITMPAVRPPPVEQSPAKGVASVALLTATTIGGIVVAAREDFGAGRIALDATGILLGGVAGALPGTYLWLAGQDAENSGDSGAFLKVLGVPVLLGGIVFGAWGGAGLGDRIAVGEWPSVAQAGGLAAGLAAGLLPTLVAGWLVDGTDWEWSVRWLGPFAVISAGLGGYALARSW